jgi:tetratricopeptide (TPR) repeat protein
LRLVPAVGTLFRDRAFVPDNAGVKWLRRPQSVLLALLAGAAIGAGAGMLAGPAWAVAGTVCGPVIVVLSAAVVDGCTTPDPAKLLHAGQHREALAVISRTLPDWRRLARVWPGQFQESLASILMTKAMALLEAHQQDEALAAAEEGVAIYRALVRARPGKQAAGLAAALNNLAYPLMAGGRSEDAVQAADEAVRLYRALTASRPQKYKYRLANSLGTRAEALDRAGRSAEALAATSESVGIYDGSRLAGIDAQNAAEIMSLHTRLTAGTGRTTASAFQEP